MQLSSFVLALLNAQAAHELGNEIKYRQLSSWANFTGIDGAALAALDQWIGSL